MRNVAVAVALAILPLICGPALAPAQGASDCPSQLWGSVSIVPRQDAPDDARRWLGLFGGGRWDEVLCHSLAVLEVRSDGSARVQYAWDVAPQWNVYRSGFDTYSAKIEGNRLVFAIPAIGANVEYVITGDRLIGTWSSGPRRARAVLKRQVVAGLPPPQQQHWLVGIWKGEIEGYTPPEGPVRTLYVIDVPDDGIAVGAWAVGRGMNFGNTTVTVRDDRVTVVTSAKSRAELTRGTGRLSGTFTPANGRSYPVTMLRVPD